MSDRRNLHSPEMKTFLDRQHSVAGLMATLWASTVKESPRYGKDLIDAQCYREGVRYAIAEIKSRTDMTMAELQRRKDALFAEKKIKGGIALAKEFKVPYVAVLYLVPDGEVIWWKVTDEKGELLLPPLRRWRGPVYQPMTGQMEMQDNVFLPMELRRHILEVPDWIPLLQSH
ncbi:MAG TPA: hypothetical protein VIT65_13875 [Microlunatus sp.]